MNPLERYAAQLDALEGRQVTTTIVDRAKDDAAEADRIHALLLQKQRSGSLGLND